MKRVNRECLVCGEKYEYCDTCGAPTEEKTDLWKALFHDENCKHIYEALSAHMVGTRSNEEIVSMLSKCDLDSITLKPTMQKAYEEIMEIATAPAPKEETKEEPTVEEADKHEEKEEAAEVETKVEEPEVKEETASEETETKEDVTETIDVTGTKATSNKADTSSNKYVNGRDSSFLYKSGFKRSR